MPLPSWVELHGALTHVPVAFLLGVAIFELGAMAFHKPEWRIVSFWLLVGAVAIAVPSLITGWFTGGDLHFIGGAAAAPAVFIKHRLFAFTTSGLAIVLLLWRVKAKDQLSGQQLSLSLLLSLIIAATVSYTGFLGGRMILGDTAAPSNLPTQTAKTAKIPTPNVQPQLVMAGQKLFQSETCLSCHRMDGKGGRSGPDLTHEALRHADILWHVAHLKDPQRMTPNSDMPAFDTLSPHDLTAIASYLATRK